MKTLVLFLFFGLGCGSVTAVPADGGAGGMGGLKVPSGSGGTADAPIMGGNDSGVTADAAETGAADSGGTATGGTGGMAPGGSGGSAGTGGAAGGSGGAGGDPCPTRFNFENGQTYGAKLDPEGTGLRSVTHATGTAFCGQGALVLDAAFTGPGGQPGSVGYVVIDLPVPESWADKTVTVRLSIVPTPPPPGPALGLTVVTKLGPVTLVNAAFRFPEGWNRMSGTMAPNAAQTTSIRIRVSDVAGYTGKVYLDEIAVQ